MIKKLSFKELEKRCEKISFLIIKRDTIDNILEELGDAFSEYFQISERAGDGDIIFHKTFSVGKFNHMYILKSLIEKGIVLERINKNNPDIPISKFIYEYCNPEGYYILERVILESL